LEFGNVYCSAYSDPHFRKLECQDLRAPGPYRAPQDAVGDSCTKFLQKCPHLFQNATRSPDRVEYKSTCGPETLAPVHSPSRCRSTPMPPSRRCHHLARSWRPTLTPESPSSPDPGVPPLQIPTVYLTRSRRRPRSPRWPASPRFTPMAGVPTVHLDDRPPRAGLGAPPSPTTAGVHEPPPA
jgi:hypothetical protein